MITTKDIEAVNLSPTRKDFYQIWNELLDVAKKISLRWDPSTTNESDPGIVLLKTLTGIADKLNYNIDVNTLEAFMPSVAQMESMRKLCDMLGYNIKYYQSAIADVTVIYNGDAFEEDEAGTYAHGVEIPMFTSFTDIDKTINYVSTEARFLNTKGIGVSVPCIEGQLDQCETDNDNVISIDQLDQNRRYFLPETQIAENGVFIYNINDGFRSSRWTQVQNLNAQESGTKIYKFGFDSTESLPYIQFPDDISNIIEDGLEIYYIRTSAANGNISARQISAFDTLPSTLNDFDNNTENYSVTNAASSSQGRAVENIEEAYNNFKKTIGTFDTLVTCRDYMNKIYQLMDEHNIPLVSNVIVSDIRNDINNSITLCSYDEYGICYNETSLLDSSNEPLIDSFTLKLYPFKTVRGLNNKQEYVNSFVYSDLNYSNILTEIDEYKVINHKITTPNAGDIVAIKNYLRLKARITTTTKVNTIEQNNILNAVKKQLYTDFNSRKLEFGEEIVFDRILESISNADERIKNVSLDEPAIVTAFSVLEADGNVHEYFLSEANSTDLDQDEKLKIKTLYNKLALRNILAGRVQMFNYDTNFKTSFTEGKYAQTTGTSYSDIYGYDEEIGVTSQSSSYHITNITTSAEIPLNTDCTLSEGEVVQFRAPNFKTNVTYPAYVNYHLKLDTEGTPAIPAEFIRLDDFFNQESPLDSDLDYFDELLQDGEVAGDLPNYEFKLNENLSYQVAKSRYTFLVYKDENDDEVYLQIKTEAKYEQCKANENVYYFQIYSSNKPFFFVINKFLKSWNETQGTTYNMYKIASTSLNNIPGYLVDANYNKYVRTTTVNSASSYQTLFINKILGTDAVIACIKKDSEYQLKQKEYLFINYTESGDEGEEDIVHNIVYEPGTILRPNFVLYDSQQLKEQTGKNYTKTSDSGEYDFSSDYSGTVQGLYSLATNEQIEIRDYVKVVLDNDLSFVYWNLNRGENEPLILTKKSTTGTKSTFVYTLQDNEYFYYTDYNQLDFAYYGSGTEISIVAESSENSYKLLKASQNNVTNEVIVEEGLKSIPWVKINTNLTPITLSENQYINLTKNDILYSGDWSLEDGETKLTNKWTKIINSKLVTFRMNDSVQNLPIICLATNNNDVWEVRSRLELDISPSKSQTLYNSYDIINLTLQATDSSEPTTQKINPLNVGGEIKPLSLKSNYTVQNSTGNIDTSVVVIDSHDNEEYTNDFKLKIFNKSTLNFNYSSSDYNVNYDLSSQIHNVDDNFTQLDFEDIKKLEETLVDRKAYNSALNLGINGYLNVPEVKTSYVANDTFRYGLLMVYYLKNDQTDDDIYNNSYITLVADTGSSSGGTSETTIFNNLDENQKFSWWSGYKKIDGTNLIKYYLKPGINIITVEKSSLIGFYPDSKFMDSATSNSRLKDQFTNVPYLRLNADTDLINEIMDRRKWTEDTYILWDNIKLVKTGNTWVFKNNSTTIDHLENVTVTAFTDVDLINELIDYSLLYWKQSASSTTVGLFKNRLINNQDKIVIGDLDLIKAKLVVTSSEKLYNSDYGINNDLLQYFTLNNLVPYYKKLLIDINNIDNSHQFYYNCLLNKSNTLNINTLASGENKENLASARVWYDKNNKNNGFVISEIDADALTDGLSIAWSSRK